METLSHHVIENIEHCLKDNFYVCKFTLLKRAVLDRKEAEITLEIMADLKNLQNLVHCLQMERGSIVRSPDLVTSMAMEQLQQARVGIFNFIHKYSPLENHISSSQSSKICYRYLNMLLHSLFASLL